MESLKTLINALRALQDGMDAKIKGVQDGMDAKIKGVQDGLAKVKAWIDGISWVARDVGGAVWVDEADSGIKTGDDGSVYHYYSGSGSAINLKVGETYTFIIDGMKFVGVATQGHGDEIYFGNPIWTDLAYYDETIEDNGEDFCVRTTTGSGTTGWRLRNGIGGHTYRWEIYRGDKPEQLPMRYSPSSVTTLSECLSALRGEVETQGEDISILRNATFDWTTSGAVIYEGHRTLRINTEYPYRGFPNDIFYLDARYSPPVDALAETEDYLTFENPKKAYKINTSNWRDILCRPGVTEVTLTTYGDEPTVTFTQKGSATKAIFVGQGFSDMKSEIQLNALENSSPRGEEWVIIKHNLSEIVRLLENITFIKSGSQKRRSYAVSVINGGYAKTGVSTNCLIHLVWDDEAGTATAEIRALDDVSDDFVAHTAADSRVALKSGEALGVALGKVAKWFGDLGTLAFKSNVGKSELDTELTDIIENSMDKVNPTGTGSFSLNRKEDSVVGDCSAAVGYYNTANGSASFAEGNLTVASGANSHAEGYGTTASNTNSHAEGYKSTASGEHSHAEGCGTAASGYGTHAEGCGTAASGYGTHAEGYGTTASNTNSHAEGQNTTASGELSHAEGYGTIAASGVQHVQGRKNIEDATERYAHIVGNGTSTTRSNAHTLDWSGNAWFAGKVYVGGDSQDDAAALDETVVKYTDGSFYMADGTAIDVDMGGGGSGGGGSVAVDTSLNGTSENPVQNKAIYAAITEIRSTANTAANTAASAKSDVSAASEKADDAKSAADNAKATADNAATVANDAAEKVGNVESVADEAKTTAEKADETASVALSTALDMKTAISAKADANDAYIVGTFSVNGSATGENSVAVGLGSAASGDHSCAVGRYCTASGIGAHTEGGRTTASGADSHAEGGWTTAASDYQHVQGKYNIEDSAGKYAHIVGNGTSAARSNAHTLDWSGNAWYKGTVECTGIIMTTPDGTKKYKVTVDNDGTLKAVVTA